MDDQPVRASMPKRARIDESVDNGSGGDSELLFITSEDESDSRFLDTTNNEEILFISDCSEEDDSCFIYDSSQQDDSCFIYDSSQQDDSRFIYDSSQCDISKGSESILFLDSTEGINDTTDNISDTDRVLKPCSKNVSDCCKNKCLESFSIKNLTVLLSISSLRALSSKDSIF